MTYYQYIILLAMTLCALKLTKKISMYSLTFISLQINKHYYQTHPDKTKC